MPAPAVGIALGLAHHADRLEADVLVGADRSDVRERGVDRDPMVPALVDQLADHLPHRLGTDASPVQRGIDEQVDLRVPVLGLGLLPVLDQPCDDAVDDDREPRRLRLIEGELVRGEVPPGRDLRGAVEAPQLLSVARLERADE